MTPRLKISRYHKKDGDYHALGEIEESLSSDVWISYQMNYAVERGKDEEGRDHDANEDHQPLPTPIIVLHGKFLGYNAVSCECCSCDTITPRLD